MNAVRGFKDILPGEARRWSEVEAIARDVFSSFGLEEIRIPILEKTDVFTRGIGEHTDIVEKEMYTFPDRNGDILSLRPEATAGVIRAVIEHKLHATSRILKLFTIGPMFRHERPQKGRLRQFHQIDMEIIGTDAPLADAEMILIPWKILKRLGVEDGLRLEINSLGCQLCRPAYRKELDSFLDKRHAELCPDCQRRSKTNPLRVFDCKQEGCRTVLSSAPLIKDHLCAGCASHIEMVFGYLSAFDAPFTINPYLVRGLDYYVRTTFEMVSTSLGAQGTVAAGGRYDGLVKTMGGPDIPGVGMAIGFERLMLIASESKTGQKKAGLFVIALGPEARKMSLLWINSLRQMGIVTQTMYEEDKGLKAQLKEADRQGAGFALIIGESEIASGKLILRDLASHEQQEIAIGDDVVHEIFSKIKGNF
jgi:histidyl-tRNA synthetase